MNKKILLAVSIVLSSMAITVLSIPAFMRLLVMMDNGITSGIESYAPAMSSESICDYLTLGKDEPGRSNDDASLFVNRFDWQDAYYCYKRDNSFSVQNQTAIMVLDYTEIVFEEALAEIRSRDGFSSEIEFSYGKYIFALNETERICSGAIEPLTDFCVSPPNAYIEWINLVGYSISESKLVFLGFYYEVFDHYFGPGTGGYPFYGWDSFIDKFFPILKEASEIEGFYGKN